METGVHRRIPAMSAVDELGPVARQHVERAVDGLVDEFGDTPSRETVEKIMDDSVSQLVGRAEVEDFLPTLAHRFTRERLKALGRARGPESALPDVLFVGLGDTGRGQMAAALLTLRSEGGVVAHSAGRTAGVDGDPAVIAVMAELNVDLAEAYAKPLSQEVLSAADVVVTMGRSLGMVQIPIERATRTGASGNQPEPTSTRCGASATRSISACRAARGDRRRSGRLRRPRSRSEDRRGAPVAGAPLSPHDDLASGLQEEELSVLDGPRSGGSRRRMGLNVRQPPVRAEEVAGVDDAARLPDAGADRDAVPAGRIELRDSGGGVGADADRTVRLPLRHDVEAPDRAVTALGSP